MFLTQTSFQGFTLFFSHTKPVYLYILDYFLYSFLIPNVLKLSRRKYSCRHHPERETHKNMYPSRPQDFIFFVLMWQLLLFALTRLVKLHRGYRQLNEFHLSLFPSLPSSPTLFYLVRSLSSPYINTLLNFCLENSIYDIYLGCKYPDLDTDITSLSFSSKNYNTIFPSRKFDLCTT